MQSPKCTSNNTRVVLLPQLARWNSDIFIVHRVYVLKVQFMQFPPSRAERELSTNHNTVNSTAADHLLNYHSHCVGWYLPQTGLLPASLAEIWQGLVKLRQWSKSGPPAVLCIVLRLFIAQVTMGYCTECQLWLGQQFWRESFGGKVN